MHQVYHGILLAILLAALAAPIASQTTDTVVPDRYATVEAESFTSLPFGRSTVVRAQQFYGPGSFTGARKLSAVAFRHDGAKARSAKEVNLEIYVAHGPATATAVSTTFAGNRVSGWRAAFSFKKVQLPAVTAAPGPRPFVLRFALDTPYLYDPKLGGLLLEIIVRGQQPGSWELDLGSSCTSKQASFGQPGCAGSNAKVPNADIPTTALLAGQRFVMRVRDALPNAPVAFLVGTIENGRWMGLQLPYALDGLGATGCWLNTDPALIGSAAASAVGEARIVITIPRLELLVGQWFRFQGLVLDGRANGLGMVLSNGSKAQVCGPDPVARVVSTNLLALVGQRDDGAVPVTRFSWQ